MKPIITIINLIFTLCLFACQSNPPISAQLVKVDALYLDQNFLTDPTPSIETEQDIFMLDADMIAMVKRKLMHNYSTERKARLLLEHIFSQDNIALSYASNANVTAREAFHNQSANCMSLTIMAYALAKEAGLNAYFQDVKVPEYWVRNGQYNLLTGHVNLLIKPPENTNVQIFYGPDSLQIDFDPYIVKETFPKKIIQKKTMLSMFYNNKGGQALVAQNYPLSYQYFKAATQADPFFSPAWGNLAVLYKLTGHLAVAEKTYRHAIALSADNLTALANLAILLRSQSVIDEAQAIEANLHRQRDNNPYYHAVLADEAYYRQNYQQAIIHYKNAIALNKTVHEFYFGLAKVYYELDNIALSKKMLRMALRLNKTQSIDNQYIAKLNFLNSTHLY